MVASSSRQYMPERGMPPNEAYQHVRSEISDAHDPALNLMQHHVLWMDPQADQLIAESFHRGASDEAVHPQLHHVQQQVVAMLSELCNAPDRARPTGTATAGGAEAVLLAGITHKWRWRARLGQTNGQPNIVVAANEPQAWLRFARYFDVELRVAPLPPGGFTLAPEALAELVDEGTISVIATLASAFNGEPDPIVELSDMLDTIAARHGWDIPLHVDASAGAFILPFTEPELIWDFRLPRVKTINICSHKYGGVYPGLGWLLFREASDLPTELLFDLRVNGRVESVFTLTSSRGGALAVGQYYNLLRHGQRGYQKLASAVLANARYLAQQLAALDRFELVGAAQRLPIVALTAPLESENSMLHTLSDLLQQRGWLVQAVVIPLAPEPAALLRFIVTEHFSTDMADLLVRDILEDLEVIDRR
jgi:glutamate decarboxylase